MRIKTLEHIHNLLKEDVEMQKRSYDYMKEITDNAYATNQSNADYLKDQQMEQWHKYNTSKRHLEDFEDEEF